MSVPFTLFFILATELIEICYYCVLGTVIDTSVCNFKNILFSLQSLSRIISIVHH